MSKLQGFLEKALKEKNRQDSRHLGDRSTYIGASDIAGCPRKAVLSRLQPVEHDAITLLRFARGHMVEELMDGIFRAGGLIAQREVELVHPEFPFLRCHIDFLFTTSKRLHVVELKSVNGIPEKPYPSWVDQLHFQMGLLEMDQPGLEIGGSILAIDLNTGQWHEFNSYRPSKALFEHLTLKGRHIKFSLASGGKHAVAEPGLLCGCCHYRSDCPSLLDAAEKLPKEVELLALQYLEASQSKKESDTRLKKLKKDIFGFTGTRFRGASDSLFITASEVGPSESVDIHALKEKYPEIYEEVKTERAGYARLDVKPRKAKAA